MLRLGSVGAVFDSSGGAVAAVVRGVLSASGPVSENDLLGLLEADGVDLGPDPDAMLAEVLNQKDEPFMPLADERWAWIPALLGGRIFTHRLNALEAARDVIALGTDLAPLTILTDSDAHRRLIDGSPITRVRPSLDGDVLAARGVPTAAVDSDAALLLPPGRFAEMGVAAGDLVGLRVSADGFELTAVTQPAPCDVGAALAAVVDERPDRPEMLDVAVWTVCASDDSMFREATAPLPELLLAGGLVCEGDWVARSGFDFAAWRVAGQIETLKERYQLDDEKALAVLAAVELYERIDDWVEAARTARWWGDAYELAGIVSQLATRSDSTPSEVEQQRDRNRMTMRATLESLAEPTVAAAVRAETAPQHDRSVTALGMSAESKVERLAAERLNSIKWFALDAVGPAVLGQLDYYLFGRSLWQGWGGPLNGQAGRVELCRQIFASLRPAAIVETGTYRGTTTEFFAEFGVPVHTAEAAPRYHAFAERRFRSARDRVHVVLADSRVFLRQLAADPSFPKDGVFFYLDAHWYSDLPLAEEIGIIFDSWKRSVIVIDDFQVLGDSYFYDDYGPGAAFNAEYLDAIGRSDMFRFYPSLRADKETGLRRGCIVLCNDPDTQDRLMELKSLRPTSLAQVERSPDDPRLVFYLAQSYFDQGDFVNARKWYARRVEMGGSDEEVYLAMYRIAQSMSNLGEPWPDVQDACLRAWAFRPTRAEPLYAIAYWYRVEKSYRLGYLFAKHAADIPFPAQDTLFVRPDIYAWRATDEQAVCASWIGKKAEAFTLWRRLLARPDLPDQDRQRIASNRDICAPTMIGAASPYPESLVQGLVDGRRDADVVVSVVAGPDRAATQQTLNSFLNCCNDVSRVGRFLMVDAGLSTKDRATLRERYGFLEFCASGPGDKPGAQLAHIRAQVDARLWLHLGQDWRFFAPENFITRLEAVLEAETLVFQVGINLADAVKLTGASAAEQAVRRAPNAGRYVLTNVVASGPAMFDTARLDRAGGLRAKKADGITALARRAAAAGLRTASLDEVLCIAEVS